MKIDALDLQNAMDNLTGIEKDRDLYFIVRKVSSSGMSRVMSFYLGEQDGELSSVTWSIAQILGYKVIDFNGFNAIRVNGCGMDMGFKIAYDLGSVIYKDGYHFRSRQI